MHDEGSTVGIVIRRWLAEYPCQDLARHHEDSTALGSWYEKAGLCYDTRIARERREAKSAARLLLTLRYTQSSICYIYIRRQTCHSYFGMMPFSSNTFCDTSARGSFFSELYLACKERGNFVISCPASPMNPPDPIPWRVLYSLYCENPTSAQFESSLLKITYLLGPMSPARLRLALQRP